jgi:predicted GNAT family N-acyltransferase
MQYYRVEYGKEHTFCRRCAVITPERFQDIPHIKGILIEEEQRNNGFGKLLLDTLCKEEDIDSVVVDAQMELTEFYAKTYPHIVYIKRRS